MTSGPPRAVDPQSPPRDIPAMPDPNRDLPPVGEGQERHWPDIPINEVPDDEREALLHQAGPVGEQARLAWNAYQENQNPTDDEDAAAVARERTRLSEMGMAPPEDAGALRAQAARGPRVETPTTRVAEAGTHGRPPGQSGAVAAGTAEGATPGSRVPNPPSPISSAQAERVSPPEDDDRARQVEEARHRAAAQPERDRQMDEDAETGDKAERAAAEKKAKAKGLEIRDFGTAGDWRVYDPKSGRQVARDKLDE